MNNELHLKEEIEILTSKLQVSEKYIRLLEEQIESLRQRNAELLQEIERFQLCVINAYEENQNLHCATTISPRIGWEALERQTAILRAEMLLIPNEKIAALSQEESSKGE